MAHQLTLSKPLPLPLKSANQLPRPKLLRRVKPLKTALLPTLLQMPTHLPKPKRLLRQLLTNLPPQQRSLKPRPKLPTFQPKTARSLPNSWQQPPIHRLSSRERPRLDLCDWEGNLDDEGHATGTRRSPGFAARALARGELAVLQNRIGGIAAAHFLKRIGQIMACGSVLHGGFKVTPRCNIIVREERPESGAR